MSALVLLLAFIVAVVIGVILYIRSNASPFDHYTAGDFVLVVSNPVFMTRAKVYWDQGLVKFGFSDDSTNSVYGYPNEYNIVPGTTRVAGDGTERVMNTVHVQPNKPYANNITTVSMQFDSDAYTTGLDIGMIERE